MPRPSFNQPNVLADIRSRTSHTQGVKGTYANRGTGLCEIAIRDYVEQMRKKSDPTENDDTAFYADGDQDED